MYISFLLLVLFLCRHYRTILIITSSSTNLLLQSNVFTEMLRLLMIHPKQNYSQKDSVIFWLLCL